MSVKVENYNADQTAELVEAYRANPSKEVIESFAEKFGKSVRSITAKLASLGIYHKDQIAKQGAKRVTKDELVRQVEVKLRLNEGTLESLTKGSHDALEALKAAVEDLHTQSQDFEIDD